VEKPAAELFLARNVSFWQSEYAAGMKVNMRKSSRETGFPDGRAGSPLPAARSNNGAHGVTRPAEGASVRIAVLVVVCFVLGIGVSTFWFQRGKKKSEAETNLVVLSESTRAVLKGLNSPIEIRFYSLLDPASVAEPVRDFAGRVDQLLAAYERDGEGKVTVKRFNTRSDSEASAAAREGIEAFNRDKGDTCFLGIAVARGSQKELFTRLSPEWEAAIESDLSRAIARLGAAIPPENALTFTRRADTNAATEVKRALPDLATVSLEDGTQLLRDTALNEYKAMVAETEARMKEAEQRLTDAQNKSEAERQAAMKELQRVRTEQTEKLKQIAARLQAQIAELQRMKKQ
jgi:hypothetical protein